MSIIKVLPENLVNQIAAGEVVERPASVVKELVENSLDAGAQKITVEIKGAGKELIKVVDDGCGMSREDCELALQRHATSKISSENDLWQIRTMGFRGEALASISSVSQLTLKSKREEDIAGTEIVADGGDIKTVSEVGMATGTVIEVRDLFFNTPARQKYLKKETTELSHINATLNTIALANPSVSFKLIHNGKAVYDLARATDLISRVADIFGRATGDAMIPIFYGGSDFQLDGYIGKPVISRSSSQHQYFFVNGRPIQHYLLANKIKEAYHSMLMEHRKPVFIINIKIDPSLIDVNVHPRKLEIRFENQQDLIRTIYSATKAALEKANLVPKGFTESQRYMADRFPQKEGSSGGSAPVQKSENYSTQDALDFSKSFMEMRDSRSATLANGWDDAREMKQIFQVANSYIVAENEEGIRLIDQHAAHERVRYEALMDQFENEEKSVQPLLVPQQVEFSNDEFNLIQENLETFTKLGFEMEEFGGKTYIINAVPSFLAKEDLDEVIKGVLDDITEGKHASKFQGKTDAIINYMACRSAIKFGQRLSEPEMLALIKQMETLKRPYTCPHGRPTMIDLSLSELDKMFGRK